MNNNNNNKKKIKVDDLNFKNINLNEKEILRENKIIFLKNKYFEKICKSIEKAKCKNKNEIHFYYNYYDFINNGLGKPHGFLNEFMYEMSYDYSKYVNKDYDNSSITFKSLYGNDFKWKLVGKNIIVINW